MGTKVHGYGMKGLNVSVRDNLFTKLYNPAQPDTNLGELLKIRLSVRTKDGIRDLSYSFILPFVTNEKSVLQITSDDNKNFCLVSETHDRKIFPQTPVFDSYVRGLTSFTSEVLGSKHAHMYDIYGMRYALAYLTNKELYWSINGKPSNMLLRVIAAYYCAIVERQSAPRPWMGVVVSDSMAPVYEYSRKKGKLTLTNQKVRTGETLRIADPIVYRREFSYNGRKNFYIPCCIQPSVTEVRYLLEEEFFWS